MASHEQSLATDNRPVPTVAEPVSNTSNQPINDSAASSSASSGSESEGRSRPRRPKLNSRKSSGTIIVPRDSPMVERTDVAYDPDDARAMSPRRNSEDLEKLGREARRSMQEQARSIQSSLAVLLDRVESVKSEHDKLEGENKFLQSYIGELMSTSKITSTGAGKGKSGRSK
ncbi:MAG: hypothetical protein M1812_003603 [Candelaria pacifica]|nr:MAG: hypothetical protein M1812_003603 [Candelaria pacifica]